MMFLRAPTKPKLGLSPSMQSFDTTDGAILQYITHVSRILIHSAWITNFTKFRLIMGQYTTRISYR